MIKAYVFTLPTCVPCKALKEQLTKEEDFFKDKVEFEWHDMAYANDFTLELATKFGIRSAPTIAIITDGGVKVFKTLDELKKVLD